MHVQRRLHDVQTLEAITETTTHSQIVLQCNDVWYVGADVDTMSWMMLTFSIFTLAVPPPKSVGGGPTRARPQPSEAQLRIHGGLIKAGSQKSTDFPKATATQHQQMHPLRISLLNRVYLHSSATRKNCTLKRFHTMWIFSRSFRCSC